MIVILKRDDLLPEYAQQTVEDLELEHVKISPEAINQAELIVFVEGTDVKFLKHRQDIQSKNSIDILLSYITSTPPITNVRQPFRIKRFGYRKRKE